VKESCGEILFFISWINQGKTDGRNLLKRFHEVSGIVISCRGARRLRRGDPEGLEWRDIWSHPSERTGGRDR
jgi:hypothetical protein